MTSLALINNVPATLDAVRDAIPDFAKDIRLNLSTILAEDGAADLTRDQQLGVALASAYAVGNAVLISAVEQEVADDAIKTAAKSAASIMAMNNIYYRFVHLVEDAEIKAMPAKLRMNVIGSPGIAKVDFELMSMAVSAINGCGMCMEAHMHELVKHGVTKQAVQTSVRIAAVIHAAGQALSLA